MIQYISTSTVNEALQTQFSPNNFVLMNELSAGLNKMQPYELGISGKRLGRPVGEVAHFIYLVSDNGGEEDDLNPD